jgi:ribosome-binding protein aMBF1 (putative translation factor)
MREEDMAHRRWEDTKEVRRGRMSAAEREESDGRAAALASALRTGIAVRDAREGVGLTQTELAIRMGIAQSAVSRIEAGRANVTMEMLTRIAIALGAPLRVTLGAGEAVLT